MGAIDVISEALRQVLPEFTKTNGAIEQKIIDVVGTYADSEALERANTLESINDALVNQKITNSAYYRQKAIEFQFGDVLLYDPVNFGGYYDPINEQNRIVKQAYIISNHPNYIMIVNGVDNVGHLRKLNEQELASFQTYFQAFEPLGLDMQITSTESAKVTDPGILIYITPGADATTVADNINTALLDYEQVPRVTNTLTLSEIEDVMQSVEGVKAISFDNPVATETLLDGTTVVTTNPVRGIFNLQTGAFSWMTPITIDMLQVIR